MTEEGQVADAELEEREEFAREIDAALEFVPKNAYAYGPKWSKRSLVWHVASVEQRGEVVRVTLEYRPEGVFKGQPGSEWIEVGPDGTVAARNQIRSPKEDLPWVLIGIAAASVITAAILVPFFLLRGPVEDENPPSVRGRALWMWADKVDVAPRFYFTGQNTSGETQNWVMRPEEPGNELALVRVQLHNDSSPTTHVLIDEEAATLESVDYERYAPIDTTARAVPLAEGEEIEAEYTRSGIIPMWGSLDIGRDEAIAGVMVFEVRAGSEFSAFRWTATDSMTVRY